ncbi:TetR/AcrR family transcriptional regulator [Streptomyces sp. NPDC002640]
MVRMSADERREAVIRAAMSEFARGGYAGTSTESIARRVGVSQPYLFRLFQGKKGLFLAAIERCMEELQVTFEEASKGVHGADALVAMAGAYTGLIADRPELLRLQMQMFVTVSAAEEAGDHEFGESVRAGWMRLWDTVHLPLGSDVDETTRFMAAGMLINSLVTMGFPAGHRVWAGLGAPCDAEAGPEEPEGPEGSEGSEGSASGE